MSAPSRGERLSILVVDDVPEIQRFVARCLEPAGHAISFASSGHEAARIAKESPVDLLITDVLMPDGDGLELIRDVKQMRPSVRILAISGGGNSLTPQYCTTVAKAMGAHAVLMKPFQRETLLGGIAAAIAA
jgi:two-component system chemotaxis response regulator CheY